MYLSLYRDRFHFWCGSFGSSSLAYHIPSLRIHVMISNRFIQSFFMIHIVLNFLFFSNYTFILSPKNFLIPLYRNIFFCCARGRELTLAGQGRSLHAFYSHLSLLAEQISEIRSRPFGSPSRVPLRGDQRISKRAVAWLPASSSTCVKQDW